MAVSVEEKARIYLIEGRIKVIRADRHSVFLEASGSASTPYYVTYAGGIWSCSCPARKPECAHVLAAHLVSPLRNAAEPISLSEDSDLDSLFI